MLTRSALLPVAALCLSLSATASADVTADRTTLLAGVAEIAAPGIPGSLCLIGDKAFPVVVGKSGGNGIEPVVAAGYLGKGRVIAFGHDGYLNEEALKTADTGKLLVNAVRWASGGKAKPRVAVLEKWTGTLAYLKAQGIDAVALPEKGSAAKLAGFDVVVGMLSIVPKEERGAYRTFAEKSGGLILAETGWGWQMINSGAPLYQNGSSEVLSAAGVLFADGMLDRTSPKGFTTTTATFPETLNAQKAIDRILSGRVTPAESKQAMSAVSRALQALPPDDTFILPRLRTLAKASSSDFSNITTKPIKMDAPADRIAFTFEVREVMALPIEKMKATPSANAFPGAISADAKRVTQTVTVNGNRGAREGTGLYAAPGDVVTITVPKAIVGKGIEVRIGAHTDTLWHLDSWKRAPQVSRTFPVDAETVKVGNAFGGTIYFDMPEAKLGDVTVTIAGAVLQPRFVLGKTTLADWKTLKDAPGTWAELEGKNCILTVPSYAVRDLADPDALMTYWDEMMRHVSDLYAVSRERPRPERYCVDVQISAGYMHSGYPIMTWDDVAKAFVDLKLLRGPDGHKTWGFYHEVGHNYQVGDWTWDGCGEVTNNLFSLYGGEKLNDAYKDGDYQNTHPAILPEERKKRLAKYRAEGPSFEKWKNDPFLALTMFIELRQAFGWEPFQKVFAEYTKLPKDQHPKTDEEKRDQFMVRFSRTTGKNLGPFFEAWAVPTSEAARKSIASLPVWLPAEMK